MPQLHGQWRSLRFASLLSQSPIDHGYPVTKTTDALQSGGLLSRLSDRTQPRLGREERRSPNARAQPREPTPNTSFISARSAQRRDHAAEKWFTDVRKLAIDNVNKSDDVQPRPNNKRIRFATPKQHHLRPKTDLEALFAPPTFRSAVSLRVQTKKELGGDYTGYLPDRCADPYRLPIDYARLAIGRNKHISLTAQTGVLNIIEHAIQGKTIRQDVAA